MKVEITLTGTYDLNPEYYPEDLRDDVGAMLAYDVEHNSVDSLIEAAGVIKLVDFVALGKPATVKTVCTTAVEHAVRAERHPFTEVGLVYHEAFAVVLSELKAAFKEVDPHWDKADKVTDTLSSRLNTTLARINRAMRDSVMVQKPVRKRTKKI